MWLQTLRLAKTRARIEREATCCDYAATTLYAHGAYTRRAGSTSVRGACTLQRLAAAQVAKLAAMCAVAADSCYV